MPLYNIEKYLSRSLNSLIAQTYKNIEIVCVNDGSTDNTLQILKDFAKKDSRIKIVNQKNKGIAAARNAGLNVVTGKYIMNCDGDDWYEPNMCELMHKTITEQNVDFVICSSHILDEEENIRQQEDLSCYELNYLGKTEINDEVISKTNILLWNKIFKMDLIKKYAINFPTGYEHDDDCFCWQYMTVAKTAYYLQEKLYNYLRRQNSIMGKVYNKTNKKSRYDMLFALEYYYQFLRRNNMGRTKSKLFNDLYVYHWMSCTSYLNEIEHQHAYKIFSQFIKGLPDETSQYLKYYCLPHRVLKIGKFVLFSCIYQRFFSFTPNQKDFDFRLVLFSKIVLFNISKKNSQLRVKILGLRFLKLKLK